jgi:hypothetical protein
MLVHLFIIGITGFTIIRLRQQMQCYQSYRSFIVKQFDKDRKIYWVEGELKGPIINSNHLLIEKTDIWHQSSKIQQNMRFQSFPNYGLKLDSHLDVKTHPSNPIRVAVRGQQSIPLEITPHSYICGSNPIRHQIPASQNIHHHRYKIPVLNYFVEIHKLYRKDKVLVVLKNGRQVIALGSHSQVKRLIAKQIYQFSPYKCGLLAIIPPVLTYGLLK